MASRYVRTLIPLLFLSLSSVLLGQETSITGTVTDQSGATIPGARVRAIPDGGGSGTTTVTGPQGSYQIPSLPAANYVVRIEAQGFTPAERTFELLVGQAAVIE